MRDEDFNEKVIAKVKEILTLNLNSKDAFDAVKKNIKTLENRELQSRRKYIIPYALALVLSVSVALYDPLTILIASEWYGASSIYTFTEYLLKFCIFSFVSSGSFYIISMIRFRGIQMPSQNELAIRNMEFETLVDRLSGLEDGNSLDTLFILAHSHNEAIFPEIIDSNTVEALVCLLCACGDKNEIFTASQIAKEFNNEDAMYIALRESERRGHMKASRALSGISNMNHNMTQNSFYEFAGFALGMAK